MYIKSYHTDQFAGLINKSINFTQGLNVILGQNESGKSTTIDGIYSTMFKNTKLKRNNNSDLKFIHKYMSRPQGEYINGQVILSKNNEIFEIKKEWGSKENIELVLPDGSLIKDEKLIGSRLEEVLVFGEATYGNIIFTRQENLKMSLKNFKEDISLSKEITDVLRKTVMELDGISIQDIENNINEDLNELYKRWDIEKNYPENNKGINNPYKTGLGLIIESFYKKEGLKNKLESLNKFELEYDNLSMLITNDRQVIDKMKYEIKSMELIEEDIRKRAMIEIQAKNLSEALNDLMIANKNWPLTEQALLDFDKKLELVEEKIGKLSKELEEVEKYKKKKELETVFNEIKELENNKKTIEDKLKSNKKVTEEDIFILESIESEKMKLESIMEAGKILVNVNKGDLKDITIVKDLQEEKELDAYSFESKGYLNIRYKDELDIEFKMQEIDYKKVREKYENHISLSKEKLDLYGVSNIEDLKVLYRQNNELEFKLRQIEQSIEVKLQGKTIDEIQNTLINFGDMIEPRDANTLRKEIENLNQERIGLYSEKSAEKNKLEVWVSKYSSYDKLFDIIVENKMELKEYNLLIENLAKLPDEFANVDSFISHLQSLRSSIEKLEYEFNINNEKYFELKLVMPDESYEEVRKEFQEEERYFNYLNKKGYKLLKIKEIFIKTKEEMFESTMGPLTGQFLEYLSIITDGKYRSGYIEEDLTISLNSKTNTIPLDLLSAGTHDSVALALRLSVIKHLFGERGFFILDDCLVDLDPYRKKESIRLIQEFACDYQVIFTTCDPVTAEMLGGNIIEI